MPKKSEFKPLFGAIGVAGDVFDFHFKINETGSESNPRFVAEAGWTHVLIETKKRLDRHKIKCSAVLFKDRPGGKRFYEITIQEVDLLAKLRTCVKPKSSALIGQRLGNAKPQVEDKKAEVIGAQLGAGTVVVKPQDIRIDGTISFVGNSKIAVRKVDTAAAPASERTQFSPRGS